MNRAELQTLARERIADAELLLDNGRWSGAYYLAGYTIECGLKSCVLAYVERTGIIFKERKFSEKIWTHQYQQLVGAAGLDDELNSELRSNAVFGGNWGVVKDWTSDSRYVQTSEQVSRAFFASVTNTSDGIFQWIQKFW